MHSNDPTPALSEAHRTILLKVARESIWNGLETGAALEPNPAEFDSELQIQRATFVTLTKGARLRGCIGSLQAHQALVSDVAKNAFSSAFHDHRFRPLENAEYPAIRIEISILTPPKPFPVESEADLLDQLKPGIDGLIIQEGMRRATFLPAVWESLAEPRDFLTQLKLKAGMPADYWSKKMQVFRYHAEKFAEKA